MNPKHLNHNTNGSKANGLQPKNSKIYLKAALTLLLTCMLGSAMAQWRSTRGLTYGGGGNGATNPVDGYGLAFGIAYDAPQGNFSTLFKPALNYNASLLRYFGDFTVGFTLGYHSYKPKDDVAVNLGAGLGDETDMSDVIDINLVYNKFKVYSAYLSGVYNIDVDDDLRVFAGANLGLYATNSSFSIIDDSGVTTFTTDQKQLYAAPKVGVMFPISSSLGISVETKYNVFFSGSSADGSGFGSAKTISGGVSLNFTL